FLCSSTVALRLCPHMRGQKCLSEGNRRIVRVALGRAAAGAGRCVFASERKREVGLSCLGGFPQPSAHPKIHATDFCRTGSVRMRVLRFIVVHENAAAIIFLLKCHFSFPFNLNRYVGLSRSVRAAAPKPATAARSWDRRCCGEAPEYRTRLTTFPTW